MQLKDYEEFQVELVENSPQEIYDITKEMLGRLDDCLRYSPEEESLHEKFLKQITSFNLSYQVRSRVGIELKNYAHQVRGCDSK